MQCTTAKTHYSATSDVAGSYRSDRLDIGFSYFSNYTIARQLVQDDVLNTFLSRAVPLPGDTRGSRRRMTFMMGAPGSGKTTRAKEIARRTGAVAVDPDWFKLRIPEFWQFPARLSSGVVHREAAFLMEIALRRLAVAGSQSVIVDTAASNFEWLDKKITWAIFQGYSIDLELMVVDRERGYARCNRRERHVPRFVIDQIYDSVDRNFMAVRKRFDNVRIKST